MYSFSTQKAFTQVLKNGYDNNLYEKFIVTEIIFIQIIVTEIIFIQKFFFCPRIYLFFLS